MSSAAVPQDPESFEASDLVWAKMRGFPHWPARVSDYYYIYIIILMLHLFYIYYICIFRYYQSRQDSIVLHQILIIYFSMELIMCEYSYIINIIIYNYRSKYYYIINNVYIYILSSLLLFICICIHVVHGCRAKTYFPLRSISKNFVKIPRGRGPGSLKQYGRLKKILTYRCQEMEHS